MKGTIRKIPWQPSSAALVLAFLFLLAVFLPPTFLFLPILFFVSFLLFFRPRDPGALPAQAPYSDGFPARGPPF